MPYFLIVPIYLLLVAAWIGLGFICWLVPRTRSLSGWIWSGTAGSLPGWLVANFLFWLILVLVFLLLKAPLESLNPSDGLSAAFGGMALIAVVVGLALTNVLGCVLGFIGGCFLYGWLTGRNLWGQRVRNDSGKTSVVRRNRFRRPLSDH
ncbi:MAG: hypothetical protein ACFCUX_05450 [Candidatus Methylacidiphilales bacterium]